MGSVGETVLVIGVGNELLSDEGLGVHVARLLVGGCPALPGGVTVIDAGTSLLDLLPDLVGHSRVILVDAIRAGEIPGTIYRAEGIPDLAAQLGAFPRSLHEWGVFETLAAAEKLVMMPERLTLIGAEPAVLDPGLQLSPRLKEAADRIVSMLVAELGISPLGE